MMNTMDCPYNIIYAERLLKVIGGDEIASFSGVIKTDDCTAEHCSKCGWNEKSNVRKRRVKKMMDEYAMNNGMPIGWTYITEN